MRFLLGHWYKINSQVFCLFVCSGGIVELGRISGTIVATQKNERLAGFKLLVVDLLKMDGVKTGTNLVALDNVGAGFGEIVIIVRGSSARQAEGMAAVPVDATIIAIVDSIEMDGSTRYRKSDDSWTEG
jgi:ethanolamine utilization protein EutN